jgi:hypothetical protein
MNNNKQLKPYLHSIFEMIELKKRPLKNAKFCFSGEGRRKF